MADEETAVKKDTSYVVLVAENLSRTTESVEVVPVGIDEEDDAQREILRTDHEPVLAWIAQPGVIEAGSQEAALSAAKALYPGKAGVATVPARSWRPQAMETVTEVRLTPMPHPGLDTLAA